MNLLLQPNDISCLPTAFAMCMGVMPKDLFDYLGHDGMEIIWPDNPEPWNRRGFSIHECIDFAVEFLYRPILYTLDNEYGPSPDKLFDPYKGKALERILKIMNQTNGVIIGQFKHNNGDHACAWDYRERIIYNPCGYKQPLDEAVIEGFIAVFD